MRTVRKQIYDLTSKDLLEHPTWEFALDEEGKGDQDEATMRPVICKEYDPEETFGVVRTAFRLADGTELIGYVTPDPEDDRISATQPTVTMDKDQIPFWFGIGAPDKRHIADLYKKLQRTTKEIFPITFRTDFPIKSGVISGKIEGFFYIDDSGQTAKTL